MFWELRPQGVSSSFTQQNLPKQSLSYIGVPLGLTLLLVNLFDFLIQRRPNEIWHNSVKLVDFNGSEYFPCDLDPNNGGGCSKPPEGFDCEQGASGCQVSPDGDFTQKNVDLASGYLT